MQYTVAHFFLICVLYTVSYMSRDSLTDSDILVFEKDLVLVFI